MSVEVYYAVKQQQMGVKWTHTHRYKYVLFIAYDSYSIFSKTDCGAHTLTSPSNIGWTDMPPAFIKIELIVDVPHHKHHSQFLLLNVQHNADDMSVQPIFVGEVWVCSPRPAESMIN